MPKAAFLQLLAIGAHRGPDQTGYWNDEYVQLGFNRLAILDRTVAGNQPMSSPHGRYQVVFNGEIYNHLQLRKQLPNPQYSGHSDTETITHALEAWGIRKTVEALDGMFALGIYDTHAHQLTLARDFAGIKPLFFGYKLGQVVFASQYDQVQQHPLFQSAPINPSVLKLYMQQHFLPAPFGLHQGLHQVRPGELITFTAHGDLRKERYWELPIVAQDYITDERTALRHIGEALQKSVSDQLVSDVPLGAFLSGGVDSPLVCSFAKDTVNDLKVFSIGSDSKVHDESARATEFANAITAQQYLWKLTADEMMAHWSDATKALHEPLADFSILPTYMVSKLAKQHVTVALSGDGGDELFFGYERFWSVAKNLSLQGTPRLLRKGAYGIDKVLFNNKHFNSLLTIDQQSKAHEGLHSRFSTDWVNKIAPDLRNIGLPDEWTVYNYPNTNDLRQLMRHMRHAEFYGMMQKTLRKVDLASMQNSIEVRVPFLQKSFIEASLQIDPLLSIQNGNRKLVLKKLLASRLPTLVDDNVKRGFSIPLGNWIRKGLASEFAKLPDLLAQKHNFFDKKELANLLSTHNNGKDLKWPLFTLYALR